MAPGAERSGPRGAQSQGPRRATAAVGYRWRCPARVRVRLFALLGLLACGLATLDPAQAAAPPPPPVKPVTAAPSDAAAGAGAGAEEGQQTSNAGGAQSVVEDAALALRPAPSVPRPPGAKPRMPRPDEDALIAAAGFRPDQVGYLVYDLDTGAYVTGHNATRPAFLPASVLKVPTMVAALSILGPEHRFTTLVRFEGTRRDDGLWRGTLALVGGGDPVLDSDDLRRLVARLQAAGLRRLEGRFVYDDSALPASPALERSQPPEHSYNPGLSALSLDFNRVRVEWRGDRVDLVESHGTPPVAPVRLVRDAAGPDWRLAGPAWRHAFPPPGTRDEQGLVTERWRLSPLARDRGAAWLPVKAPAPFVAAVFRALAAEADIALPEAAPARGPARGPIVARHRSAALDAIAAAGLKYSNNLLAELVGLAAARRLAGRPLAIPQSAARLERWLAEALPWVDWSGFRMANHSGLSPHSRASPEQIVALLRFAQDRGRGLARRGGYAALMPLRRFPDPRERVVAAQVRAGHLTPLVRAKSGTMYFGRGLAGYARGESGHRLVFAVFTSDLAGRRAFDEGYLHYSGRAVSRARADLGRARDLEHALLLKWIAEN